MNRQRASQSRPSAVPVENLPESTSQTSLSEFLPTGHLRREIGSRALRGSGAVLMGEVGAAVLRVASIAILARILLPEEFGLLAMVTVLTVFAERVKDFGLGDATIQARDVTQQEVTNLFWLNLLICVGIALALAAASQAITWFYGEPRLTGIVLVLASTFLFSGLVIQHQALLRRQLRFGTLATIHFISVLLSLVVAVGMALLEFGYWALVAREFARAAFVVLGTWIACPWRPQLPDLSVPVRRFLLFGSSVTGYNLVHFFSRGFDKLLIGKFFGAYWVGLYTNAHLLLSMPINHIQYPLNTVALPTLSALSAEPAEFRSHFTKMLRLLTFFSMPIVACSIIVADLIVAVLLGAQWEQAAPIFRVLAVGAFFDPIVHFIGPAIVASGRPQKYFRLGAVNALALVSCLAVGSLWGTIGVAAGLSTAIIFSLATALFWGLRFTPIKPSTLLRQLSGAIVCSVMMGLLLLAARFYIGWTVAPLTLFPLVGCGALLYLGIWLLIPGGRLTLRENFRDALQIVKRRA